MSQSEYEKKLNKAGWDAALDSDVVKNIVDAANKCKAFMECFEAGQKRMSHDLNIEDTMAAVTASIELRESLEAFNKSKDVKP